MKASSPASRCFSSVLIEDCFMSMGFSFCLAYERKGGGITVQRPFLFAKNIHFDEVEEYMIMRAMMMKTFKNDHSTYSYTFHEQWNDNNNNDEKERNEMREQSPYL